jgi:hypothetical protein
MQLPNELVQNQDDCVAFQDIPSLDKRQPLEIPIFEEKKVCLPTLKELDRMTEIKFQQRKKRQLATKEIACARSSRKVDDNDVEELALEVEKVLSKRK